MDVVYTQRGDAFAQLWQHIPLLKLTYFEFENRYDPDVVLFWMRDHWEVPILAVLAYVVLIVAGPKLMDKLGVGRLELRAAMATWNALLSVFSFIGMLRTAPHLLHNVANKDYMTTVCTPPHLDWGSGATGLWVQLFILSKIPELIDTLWLVLKRRDVIFLHWYHHITVLLYCWHAYTNEAGAGLYFVAMNYSVHAIMYGYYCLMTLRVVPKWFPAWWITIAQIAQMFIGTGVCISCWYFMLTGAKCHNALENLIAGGLMYGSYLYLFVEFAVKRFVLNQKVKGE